MKKIIWLFVLLFFTTSVQSKMAFLPAPLSVMASSNLVESIKITWKENSKGGAVDFYTIYRSSTPDITGKEELGTIKAGVPLVFTDLNLIPLKKYYYWVVSCPPQNAGFIAANVDAGVVCSNIFVQKAVVGQAKNRKMPVPSNFKVSNNAEGFVLLQWDSVSSASSYRVRRDGKSYEMVTTNSFIDKNVVAKKSYTYDVSACDQFKICGGGLRKGIKAIGVTVAIPSVTSISATPQSITQGQSLTLSATLNGVLPTGYNVKVNYGNGLTSMSSSGTNFSLTAIPTLIGSRVYLVGIYDNENILKSNQLKGNFSVTAPILPDVLPTVNFISGDSETVVNTDYNVQLSVQGADSIEVDWGDETINPQPTYNNVSTTLSFSHNYAVAGTYKIRATVQNSSGSTGQVSVFKTVLVRDGNNLSEIFPTNGMSGTEITLIGTGFSEKSQVLVGGQIAATRYVSDTELHFAIPFTSINGQINSLPADKYSVQVNGGNKLELQVEALPLNPNPAGAVLNDHIIKVANELTESIKEYEAVLPNLLEKAKNNPKQIALLNSIEKFANQLSKQDVGKTTQDISRIDPQALDLLERSLLSGQQKTQTKTVSTSSKSQLIVTKTKSQRDVVINDGDIWLQNRKAVADAINTKANVSKYASWGCLGVGVATGVYLTPAVGIYSASVCNSLLVTAELSQIMNEVSVSSNVGRVSKLRLEIAPSDTVSNFDSALSIDKPIMVYVDNYNNSEKNPTDKAVKITGATFYVSNELPSASLWLNITQSLSSLIPESSSVTKAALNTLLDTIKEYTASQVDSITADESGKSYHASLKTLEAETGAFFSTSCKYQANADLKTNGFSVNEDGTIVVPDIGYSSKTNTFTGICYFKIKKELRIPAEDNVYSRVDFYTSRYIRLGIIVNSDNAVQYSNKTMLGGNFCNGKTTCDEYFNLSDLTLTTEMNSKWTGMDDKCNDGYKTCVLKLDSSNKKPLTITITDVATSVKCTYPEKVTDILSLNEFNAIENFLTCNQKAVDMAFSKLKIAQQKKPQDLLKLKTAQIEYDEATAMLDEAQAMYDEVQSFFETGK